jgi:hypothetical protein
MRGDEGKGRMTRGQHRGNDRSVSVSVSVSEGLKERGKGIGHKEVD